MEICPGYLSAMNNLGMIYIIYNKNYDEAEKWLNKAILSKDNYAEAHYNLARLKLAEKDTLTAKTLLIKALKNDDKNIFIMNDLANLYFSANQKDSANLLNEKIIITNSSSDIPYINMGNYALLSHDTNNAVMNWQKAIEKNQNNATLIYGLSRYFGQHGNKEKADYYNRLYYKIQKQK